MDNLAKETWNDLSDSDARGMKWREDSFTDRNLLELSRLHSEVVVRKLTQSDEKNVGADWEWWVGADETGVGWVCIKIQAKRVHGRAYTKLHHHGPGDRQHDTLIGNCDPTRREYPFHVFYNGWQDERFDGDDLLALDASAEVIGTKMGEDVPNDWIYAHLDPTPWGCAAMSSERVRDVYKASSERRVRGGATYAPLYLRHSIPWRELFCPPDVWTDYDPGRALDKIEFRLHSLCNGAPFGSEDQRQFFADDLDRIRHSRLPGYVREALRPRSNSARPDRLPRRDGRTHLHSVRQPPKAVAVINLGRAPLFEDQPTQTEPH